MENQWQKQCEKAVGPREIMRRDVVISQTYRARYELYFDGGYGIAAVLYRNGEACDSASVADITADGSEARRLFEEVADGGVSPCTLQDIIEDWLGR